jgi:hypothetical protein
MNLPEPQLEQVVPMQTLPRAILVDPTKTPLAVFCSVEHLFSCAWIREQA